MSEHPSHKLDAYHDGDHKSVVFCRVCSREEENLGTPCPGKFVPLSHDKLQKEVDNRSEQH
mgnify:FL=1